MYKVEWTWLLVNMPTARSAALVRPWRGVSAEDRTSERHERLMEAGLEVFATTGYAASSVREISRAAGLTERYFYESFENREALLSALADLIVSDFLAAAAPVLPLDADDLPRAVGRGVEAFVASLADDPRRARVLMVETVGVSPAAEEHRRAVIGGLVAFIRQSMEQVYGHWARESTEVELLSRSLIGAAQELLVAHVRGELGTTRSQLVENLTWLFLAVGPIVSALPGYPPQTPSQSKEKR